jgi:hypothetical protein
MSHARRLINGFSRGGAIQQPPKKRKAVGKSDSSEANQFSFLDTGAALPRGGLALARAQIGHVYRPQSGSAFAFPQAKPDNYRNLLLLY